jgi:N-acylneuraminate cytidylyltransferase
VSTDDAQIAAAAEREGAEVVWRPAEISGDTASSESALLHVLSVLEARDVRPERLVFLQCTSPFTTGEEIDRCVAALDAPTAMAAFSAKLDHGFYWKVDEQGLASGVNHDDAEPRKRRQDLAPQYRETGSIYVMRVSAFLRAGVRFCGPTVLVPIDAPLVEIDTPEDLAVCEAIARRRVETEGRAVDLSGVEALVMDFDGVLTDDRVVVFDDGREAVVASRADGLGLEALRRRGLAMLILSKETNQVVTARGLKLQIEVQQAREDKLSSLRDWLATHAIPPERVVYIGNDINDLSCLRAVGFPIAPADARPEVRAVACHVTARPGGFGAVREIADLILAGNIAAGSEV